MTANDRPNNAKSKFYQAVLLLLFDRKTQHQSSFSDGAHGLSVKPKGLLIHWQCQGDLVMTKSVWGLGFSTHLWTG